MTKLSYAKTILEKVSFDKKLFWKEYRKQHKWLSVEETAIFKRWFKFRYRKRSFDLG